MSTELPWVVIIKILNEYYLMFITVSLHYHCLFFSVYRFPSNLFSISIHNNLGLLCHNASDFSLCNEPMGSYGTQGVHQVPTTDETRRLLCSEQSPTFFSKKEAISFKKCCEQKIYN